jgi:hypothetical protein
MFGTSRAEIASAITGSFGGLAVIGHDGRPNVIGSGDAWPRVDSIDRGPGDAFLVNWNVIVVLSSDEGTALTQIGDVLPALVAQIESTVGYVDGASPVSYSTEAGELFALQINMRSE